MLIEITDKMPTCRYHQTKFKAVLFNQKYCLSDEECKNAATQFVLGKIKQADERKKAKEVKEERKEWNEYKKARKPIIYQKKNTNLLQDGVNMLARMIDIKFYNTCICCDKPFKEDKQQHGAHFIDVGGHNSTRYHLHIIHASNSYCNQYSSTHKAGYAQGLIKRYGSDYLEMVEGLPLKHPKIKLSALELTEKLTIVRKLIRDFDSFVFTDGRQARELLNKLIGIYE